MLKSEMRNKSVSNQQANSYFIKKVFLNNLLKLQLHYDGAINSS